MAPTRNSTSSKGNKAKPKKNMNIPSNTKRKSTTSHAKRNSTTKNSKPKRNSAASVASKKSKSSTTRSTSMKVNNNKNSSKRNSSSKNLDNSSKRSNSQRNNNNSSASTRNNSHTPAVPALTAQERHIQSLVANGAYHLPGNGWCQDWIQYVCNNHPLLAPCCQHKLHPISKWMRAVGLLGSLMMGLVITNLMYLLLIHNDNDPTAATATAAGAYGDTTPVFQLSAGGFAVKNGTKWVYLEEDSALSEYTSLEVSSGMIILWTVGGVIHALWDNTVWYMTSCLCFSKQTNINSSSRRRNSQASDEGCCAKCIAKSKGLVNVLVVTGVLLITAAATVAVVVRAHVEGGGDVNSALQNLQSTAGFGDRVEDAEVVSNKDNYEYLLSYSVELALAWFLWFPLLTTIMFSGIFSRCLPFLGGRPQEVKEEEQRGRLPR